MTTQAEKAIELVKHRRTKADAAELIAGLRRVAKREAGPPTPGVDIGAYTRYILDMANQAHTPTARLAAHIAKLDNAGLCALLLIDFPAAESAVIRGATISELGNRNPEALDRFIEDGADEATAITYFTA